MAERIVGAFSTPFVLGDDLHGLSVSIGVSMYPRDGNDAATLIRLRGLDCNEVQGYLIARPLAAGQMARLMRRRYLHPVTVAAARASQLPKLVPDT